MRRAYAGLAVTVQAVTADWKGEVDERD